VNSEIGGSIEKLAARHDLSTFSCGRSSLDDWLRRFALANQRNDSARTYVFARSEKVAGYYSLSAGSVRMEEAPARIAKGLARHPIGVILLARLAINLQEQGTGLGKLLLSDALGRCLAASDSIGARAVLVHAIDDAAAAFYKKFDFAESPIDPHHLMLLMKDLRASWNAIDRKF
jgi:GNAT superfamily N-acetyltransferase